MKFLHLFNEFERGANGSTPQLTTRREAFGQIGRTVGKAATVALPLAAFLKSNPIAAQSSGDSIVDVLNFALTLEYLEAEYYAMGLDSDGLLTGDLRETISLIGDHEAAHVEFLKSAISGAGGDPVDKPDFDFTAGGNFNNVFSNQTIFLALAQAFEDTGVRAYKGQAANLMGNGAVLTAALQIHSVEARHASEIRRIRGSKGWITNAENTTGAGAADAVYMGEDNVMQLGFNVTTLTSVSRNHITEAWDEPLSKQAVLDIASLFIAD
ncbi:ferritin-like domain-containing protein [Neolewinella litorea]|uniref:Ferritin-like domain-containing protein n=1 Tax=Neolewinella litorea TaxID=2562452 RepID=A0A4S4NSK2_9BACT|nr:ferritin-like domain-containing protein [Neolewinella litorea]THH41418.1 ferritin-like domain-containing protein [Neolewinella litorea]